MPTPTGQLETIACFQQNFLSIDAKFQLARDDVSALFPFALAAFQAGFRSRGKGGQYHFQPTRKMR